MLIKQLKRLSKVYKFFQLTKNNLRLIADYDYEIASAFASNFDKVIKKNTVLYKAPESLNKKEDKVKFGGFELPSTIDFTQWGKCIISNDYSSAKVIKLSNNKTLTKYSYTIKIKELEIEVEYKIEDKVLLTFTDSLKLNDNLISNNLNWFTRKINNNTYVYEEGKRILILKQTKTKFISKINPTYFRSKNFITLDLETKVVNKNMYPYCSSIYDGQIFKTFYITDYEHNFSSIEEQSKALLVDSILYLLKPKYSGYKVYIHNFSYFDGIFIMKILTDLNILIKPIIRDGRFIETKIYYDLINKDLINEEFILENDVQFKKENNSYLNDSKNYRHSLSLRDSLLLLTSSLDELGQTFKLEIKKDIFPYEFVNLDTTSFNYKGECPKYKFFDDEKVSETAYEEYLKRFNNNQLWDLKKETISYCENDVNVLYKILDKFSSFIFENYYVDIMKSPTISSLA